MGLGEVPRNVRAGEDLPARWLNALRGLVLRSRIVKVDNGLLMQQSEAGTSLSLSLPPQQLLPGVIVSDHPQVETAHATLTYDVRVNADDRDLTGLTPINRMVRASHVRKVIPAPKGSPCLVLFPVAEDEFETRPRHLIVFDEVVAERSCTGQGDGSPDAPPVPLPFDAAAALAAEVAHLRQRLDVLELGMGTRA